MRLLNETMIFKSVHIETEKLVGFVLLFFKKTSRHVFLLSIVGFLTQATKETLTIAHISDVENGFDKCTVNTKKQSAPFAVDPGSPHFP